MRIKTQHLAAGTCFALIFIQLISCKKDNSAIINANSPAVNNAVADSSLTKGLVAWYTFDGDALDHSGHHNNVTFNSAKPTKGKSGLAKTAYVFDGAGSYMEVPDAPTLNPLKISIYALIKPTDFYAGPCHANYVISKEYTDNDNGRYVLGFGDQAFYNYSGCYDSVAAHHENFFGTYGDGAATASGATDFDHYINVKKWYSVVYTFDGVYSKLYVNGTLVSKVVKYTTFTPNTNPLYIGRNEDPGNPYYFKGIIDEIRIYKRVLNASEVSELYNTN
ncbi:MAG: LamG domain-containing protein [Parafilimonas sp.]|nr:LamG domain-containing protein [Parafilimonas sp.]